MGIRKNCKDCKRIYNQEHSEQRNLNERNRRKTDINYRLIKNTRV